MSEASRGAREGLLGSLSALAATLAGTVRTRLDLPALDVEEERAHVFYMLGCILAAAFFFGLAILLGSAALVVTYWFTNRLLVLTLLAVVFLVAGILALACARRRATTKSALFASSRAQFDEDRRDLAARA